MVALLTRRMYANRKPPASSRIDGQHPLARDLRLYVPMLDGGGSKAPPNLALPTDPVSLVGSAEWRAGMPGTNSLGIFSDDVAEYANVGSSEFIRPAALPISIMARFAISSLSAVRFVWGNDAGGANIAGVQITVQSSGVVRVLYSDNTGGVVRGKDSTQAIVVGRWYTVVGVLRGATDMTIYIDGLDDGGTYAGLAGSLAYSAGAHGRIGSRARGLQTMFGTCDLAGLWARELSNAEAHLLFEEPFALLEPPIRFFFIPPPAGGGTHFSRSLVGAQPSASAAATRVYRAKRSAVGSQPTASATLARVKAAPRVLAGAQPAFTGVLSRTRRRLTSLLGSQTTATALVNRAQGRVRALLGTQPSSSSTLIQQAVKARSLAGAQPAAIGVLEDILRALRSLTGVQPSASGALSRLVATARPLNGTQPNASGVLARLLRAIRLLVGAQTSASGVLITQPQQVAFPDVDVAAGSWTTHLGGTTNLSTVIDEVEADDADYVHSSLSPVIPDEYRFRLGPMNDPTTSGGHVGEYRYSKDQAGGDRIDLTVTLYRSDGTTVVASQTHQDVGALVSGELTLSEAEADSLSSDDYVTGLVVGLKAVKV